MSRDARAAVRRHSTIHRSWGLLRAFQREQSEPDAFYSVLADDSVAQLSCYLDLQGATVLDVGGGPGFFADAYRRAGATYVAADVDAGEMRLHGRQPGPLTVQASGLALPFADNSVDVAYSSNVLEHVSQPWTMADEMVRVTRPGGHVVISYTLWFGPWGGHETSPWHLLGGARAADRYARRTGHRPKNDFGITMFPVTAGAGLAWARSRPTLGIVAAVPRYLPAWAAGIVRVPGLREVLAWNLLLVLEVTA